MKQKLLILLCVLLATITASAYDFAVKNSDGVTIYYNKLDDSSVAVTYKSTSNRGYTNASITIPSSVTYGSKTYSVTSIGNNAFNYCSSLTSVTIPNSVTSIGESAFSGCSRLTSVTLNSVISIGAYAFSGCSDLNSFYGNYASADNRCLIIDGELKAFAPYGLTKYTIPESVTSIGQSAFSGCGGLTSVTIPNSVTSIGRSAFSSCSGLTLVEIPNSVTSIGDYAFSGCIGLISVTIPEFISSIGICAFMTCESLTTVNFNATNCITMGAGGSMVFYGCSSITILNIGDNVSNIPSFAFSTCSGLTSVTIPESVTSIGDYAFQSCSGLTSVTIPNSVTSIGNYAFSNCSSLTSVTIPNSVTSIGDKAFYSCSGLTSVTIGNSVTSIGQSAFTDCSGLTSVTIPNSVTSIGDYAFSNCRNLTSVAIGNSVTSIGKQAFLSCTNLTSVTIPNSVTSIGDTAFGYCGNLTSVAIGNSVTSIGKYAFEYCSILTSVTIPESVKEIGYQAFLYCNGLTEVTVESDNPTNITLGSSVFYNVPKSTCTLYVPKGSKELYAAAAQWSAFTNIEEFTPVTALTDGEAYAATEDQVGVDINYTRNFSNTEWQPLYVPFNMSYEEWSPYADVAEVHNVLGYDTDNDGVIDDIIIEFNKVTSGEINPNVPYVIKAKEEGKVTFECTGKTVLAAPAEEGTVECSSTKMTYRFHGVYQPKTDMHTSGAYHLSGGAFHHTTTDEAVLPPFRFYMMVTPKTGGYNPASAPQMIKMKVDGEDVTTSIVGVEVDVQDDGIYYDMMGRKLVNPAQGIYIKNGKKVFVK